MDAREVTGGTIFGIIVLVGAILVFAQKMTLVFGILTFFGIIISLITGIIDFNEGEFKFSIIPLILTAICFVFFILFLSIGYGIGETALGQASIETYGVVTDAQQQVDNSVDLVIQETIDASCETLDESNCQILRSSIKTYQTTQDVIDVADKLRNGVEVMNRINE